MVSYQKEASGEMDEIFETIKMPLNPLAKRVLKLSSEEACQLGHSYIGSEHLLLGMLREGEGVAARVLENLHIDPNTIRTQVTCMVGESMTPASIVENATESKMPRLEEFGTDLTKLAEEGKLNPFVGREEQIEIIIQILLRRTRRNPCLVGEDGVGKNTIAEGVALRISSGNVPETIAQKKVVKLDMDLLFAGTKSQEELEQRLQQLLVEIRERNNIILFVDEVHTLFSECESDETKDPSKITTAALERGEIQCIGTSTRSNYRYEIENKKPLSELFCRVKVPELSPDETVQILKRIRGIYENYHKIHYTDEALEAAAELSKRYIDGVLPGKAIDLIDEAACVVRVRNAQKLWKEANELEKKPEERIEENNEAANDQDLCKTGELHDKEMYTSSATENEKEKSKEVVVAAAFICISALFYSVSLYLSKYRERGVSGADKVEPVNDEETTTGSDSKKPDTASPSVEEKNGEESRRESQGPLVTVLDIRKIVASRIDLPLEKVAVGDEKSDDEKGKDDENDKNKDGSKDIKAEECQRLLSLEVALHKRIVGQHNAVTAVSRAIRRAGVGIRDPNRPIASFLFTGPTGVGKTELAKFLALEYFGSKESMVRMDMSEFMEEHSVSRLFGSPPGYVGYVEGGQLTNAVEKCPESVVLFDEIEKAHPRIFDALLQILDEGRLTDGSGDTTDFKKTIIIMTSNVGGRRFFQDEEDQAAYVKGELKEMFRAEFLNRLDDVIIFKPLTTDEVKQIMEILVKQVQDRLVESRNVRFEVTEKFKRRVLREGYDHENGGRPLRRTITRLLEDTLCDGILKGDIKSGSSVTVDVKDDQAFTVYYR